MTDTPTEREEGGGWARLRRRKVVQWGVAYAAAAWTLLQIIEYLAETYGWPPAIRQIAVPTFSLLSLFVMVLAWHHGDKGRQKISRQELALLAWLLLAAGGVLWWFVARLDANDWLPASEGVAVPHAVPTDAPSVAVLPFVNMSSDPEQEYFSDGLSEEILNALARIPGLYVPARTSSFQFKGQSGDVARFAAMLGVAHVLEGSVRKSGGRVRITAQLVSAADGYHVWSQTYDRELNDIFAIQTEISNAIADALQLRLTAQQKLAAELAPPTRNLDAYQAYLLGRYELAKYQRRSIALAVQYFREAIALDPEFADAYAVLSMALRQTKYHPNAPDPGRREYEEFVQTIVMPVLSRAQALGPDRPEVLAATAWLASRDGDLERALEYYDRALAQMPNNGSWLIARSGLLWALGRFDQALSASYEAVKRDPLSRPALNNHVIYLLIFGRRAEVDPIVERYMAINEVQARGIRTIVASYDGDRPEAVRQYLIAFDLLTAQDGSVAQGWRRSIAEQFARLGMRTEVFNLVPPMDAHYLMGEYEQAIPDLRSSYRETDIRRDWLANALYGAGQFCESAALYKEFLSSDRYPDADMLLRAGDALRRCGDVATSRQYRDRAADLLHRAAAAGVLARVTAFSQAMLHAYDQEDERAAASIIVAMDAWNTFDWPYDVQLRNPLTDDLFQRPDVQAALRKNNAVIAQQRTQVLEMLCGPHPVAKTYKPAPETCAKWKSTEART